MADGTSAVAEKDIPTNTSEKDQVSPLSDAVKRELKHIQEWQQQNEIASNIVQPNTETPQQHNPRALPKQLDTDKPITLAEQADKELAEENARIQHELNEFTRAFIGRREQDLRFQKVETQSGTNTIRPIADEFKRRYAELARRFPRLKQNKELDDYVRNCMDQVLSINLGKTKIEGTLEHKWSNSDADQFRRILYDVGLMNTRPRERSDLKKTVPKSILGILFTGTSALLSGTMKVFTRVR